MECNTWTVFHQLFPSLTSNRFSFHNHSFFVHAANSWVSVSISLTLLPVHSTFITLISISAALNQFACFGEQWVSRASKHKKLAFIITAHKSPNMLLSFNERHSEQSSTWSIFSGGISLALSIRRPRTVSTGIVITKV